MISITGIISALLFYSIPVIIGRPLVRLSWLKKYKITYPFAGYFVVGMLVLYVVALCLYGITSIFHTETFISIYTGFLIIVTTVACIGNLFSKFDDFCFSKQSILAVWLPTAFSAILTAVAYYLWHTETIYPFNWDIYEHQTLVNAILEGHFSFFTSRISDTFGFDGYSSILHLLMATSQLFTSPEIFDYWNSISLVHCFLLTLSAYFLGFEITKKPIVGMLAMLFCVFLFDSVVSFSTLFFIPQTFTACLFAYAWLQIISSSLKSIKLPFVWVGIWIATIILNHYIIGAAAVAIYLITYFYIKYHEWLHTHIHLWRVVIILVLCGAALIAISPYIPLGFLNKGEAEAYTFTFAKKFEIMRQMYGFFLAFFMPISVFITLKSKNELHKFILFLCTGVCIIVIAQLPYAVKFFVIGRQFIHIILAIGIFKLVQYMPRATHKLAYLALCIALICIYVLNANYWKSNLRYHEYYAHISPYELEAAAFLKNNYSRTSALLISDPATQHILEPFSNVNTQGGAYMSLATRQLLHDVGVKSEQSDIPSILADLQKIKDPIEPTPHKRLFVVSGRYFLWQYSKLEDKESLSYNIWYPVDFTSQNKRFLLLLAQYPLFFTKVFENQAVAIFELNP